MLLWCVTISSSHSSVDRCSKQAHHAIAIASRPLQRTEFAVLFVFSLLLKYCTSVYSFLPHTWAPSIVNSSSDCECLWDVPYRLTEGELHCHHDCAVSWQAVAQWHCWFAINRYGLRRLLNDEVDYCLLRSVDHWFYVWGVTMQTSLLPIFCCCASWSEYQSYLCMMSRSRPVSAVMTVELLLTDLDCAYGLQRYGHG